MGKNYTKKDVIQNNGVFDYTGKIVVINVRSLKPEYRMKSEQLVYAYDGHGCRSTSFGDKMFCYDLNNHELCIWSRWDILGELKEKLVTAEMLEIVRDFEKNRNKMLRNVLEDLKIV